VKLSRASVGKIGKNRSQIHKLILLLLPAQIAVLFNILPGNFIVYSSFASVLLLSSYFKSEDLIKATLLLFVFNGIMRRIAASDTGYFTANDILIFLPYVPIVFLLFKNLKVLKFELQFLVVLYLICILALFSIQQSVPNIVWGLVNLIMVIILGQVSKEYFNEALIAFIIKLGLVSAVYIFVQKVSLPEYDVGWCQNRKSGLVILESCTSTSTRLWGTMESAVNMACFLSVCFLLLIFRNKKTLSLATKVFQLGVIFVALFLTGTRTFIFIIPLAYLLGVYFFRKLSVPGFVFGVLSILVTASLLPNLALLFDYEGRWVSRLDLTNLTGDRSLTDRIGLVASFKDQLSLKNLLIGDGLGSKSRGSLSIDNGYLSLVLEIGLPLTIILLIIIFMKLKNVQDFENPLVLQSWSVCILLVFANASYVVLTGPSSVYFWIFLFMVNSRGGSDKVQSK
jgi:hypothetical protein